MIESDRPDWHHQAACRDLPPDVFFPDGIENCDRRRGHRDMTVADYSPRAAAACNRCPVTDQCLAYALEHHVDGIWAGTSPNARARLRKAAGISPKPLIPAGIHGTNRPADSAPPEEDTAA